MPGSRYSLRVAIPAALSANKERAAVWRPSRRSVSVCLAPTDRQLHREVPALDRARPRVLRDDTSAQRAPASERGGRCRPSSAPAGSSSSPLQGAARALSGHDIGPEAEAEAAVAEVVAEAEAEAAEAEVAAEEAEAEAEVEVEVEVEVEAEAAEVEAEVAAGRPVPAFRPWRARSWHRRGRRPRRGCSRRQSRPGTNDLRSTSAPATRCSPPGRSSRRRSSRRTAARRCRRRSSRACR